MEKYLKSKKKDNIFKIFSPTWKGKFELPDKSYSISDI